MANAKKIKIYIKTGAFILPLPAISLNFVSRIIYIALKHTNKHSEPNQSLSRKDILRILEVLKQHEPFEMVDIEAYDDKNRKVVVKIHTIWFRVFEKEVNLCRTKF